MRRTRAYPEPIANNPLKPPPNPFSSVAATVIMDEAAKLGPELCPQPWCVKCKDPHDKQRKTVVTYMEILSLLADRDKNFWWDTFSHRVVAEYPSSWDFLNSMGKSHLTKYRGLTWEPFLACHQGCQLRLRPIEIAPTVMEFNFRDKNRLDLEEKMGDSLYFSRWDRVNLPWERRHFFNMVTWGKKTYHMVANTIKMGWLTWSKEHMMLCGTQEAWANHQCDQLKVWKGRAFHDFYNWMYILGDKPDFSAYKAFDFLFASNFFKQIQPNRVEWNKLANEQAPLVFGLGTTNRVAKSMWAAINQLQRETTHQYMVLLYKDMNFNQHTGEIYGPPSAWALVKKSFEDGIVDFDGTKFRKKANPLFRNGLYYFEDDIADHVEKIMHAGQFKSREKLLQNPGCSKKWAAMKRKMERMEQDTRYLKIRTAYTTKKSNKLTGNTVNFSTMERSMARGALLDNSPPTVNTHCHLCSCADCPCVNCEFKLQRIINIKSREERKYAGLPVTRHQLYLFDECTQWSVLQSIVQNDFGLLQKRYEKPCFRALDEVNFQKWCGDAYLKLVSGVRKAEKDPDGRVSVPRLHDVLCRPAGPFDEGTDHYNGNADLGLNIYLTYAHNDDIIDEDESFSLTLSRCLKSLRKMVAHAGEAGKADLLVYFDILDIKVKDFADPHAKIMAFLHEISAFDDMSTKDWERYNLKSRVLILESKWDVGCGFVLKAQDMVHESMVAYIRKYVIERGMDLTVRQGTLKRIQDAGIEVEDILSSGDMDSAEYNEGFRAWLFAEGSESARVEKRRYNLFIDVYSSARREAREKEKVAEAYGIKNRLDLGFGIRLCLKALDRMGATKRTGWRKVVEDNGPSKEGRKKSMEQLRQAKVKVVDLLRDTTECSYGTLGYDYPSDYPSGVAYKDGVLMPRVE